MARPDPARRAALGLIVGVTEDHETIADQIAADALDGLEPNERARAQRLALSTLRHLAQADAMLKPYLRKRPPADLIALLRLATVELCADGAAPHGVVDAAVTLARSGGKKTGSFAGLINAVLRKVSEDRARWETLPPPALPGWLRGRLMSAYGKQAVQAMEAAHLAGAPLDLSLKAADTDLAEALGAEVLPTGSLRIGGRVQVSGLPGFEAGDWWVQDAAAALAAKLLAPQPGESVLDLCAAPGGKSLQLAAAGARVTALDISPARMARIEENLARTGLEAELVVADALDWQPEAPFDAILLDAPCSATGTIRRHPDLPFVKSAAGIKELFALQEALLERALGWLKPGGRLVYCTCSLLPEEGEAQIKAALERDPALRVVPAAADWVEPGWQSPEGGLRLRPDFWADRGGMDGFYIARLERAA
ncbi:RsmB/NOP family class I SAM-dependent RNA methyltransferase [Pseudothioclava nitratireducens]|uniref:RsmB/NOP family class I SAM-dependent RNA methyltransferase n=1 Tax=Pseudothioclava nitratireducens TaxID=1928646 RepID=UPI0023DA8D65|nr:transcription antitermination factor NusB [Defluviimonas nitratireducens]MDF1620345.1 transcription antitermination factor NusB [Defluviimonas nitratireducens]